MRYPARPGRNKHNGTADPSLRCFLAWTPGAHAHAALIAMIDRLAAERTDPGYRWTRPEQLHLTLRFLGASRTAQLEALADAIAPLAAVQPPIAVWTAGWQFWPSRSRPAVLVLRIESHGALDRLGAALETRAVDAGFAPEPRAFRAHLTLARIATLRAPAAPLDAPPPRVELAVDHVALFRSEPTPRGSRYTGLARWPLAAGP